MLAIGWIRVGNRLGDRYGAFPANFGSRYARPCSNRAARFSDSGERADWPALRAASAASRAVAAALAN